MPESPRLPMHDIPDSERPRERLLTQGPGALSNAELLAILLRTGTSEENVLHLAERMLAQFGGLQEPAEVSCAELLGLKGLGSAKVAQMAAAGEKRLLLCPIGFVCDHIEIPYDLDIELKRQVKSAEIFRTPSLNTNPQFIRGLANRIQKHIQNG